MRKRIQSKPRHRKPAPQPAPGISFGSERVDLMRGETLLSAAVKEQTRDVACAVRTAINTTPLGKPVDVKKAVDDHMLRFGGMITSFTEQLSDVGTLRFLVGFLVAHYCGLFTSKLVDDALAEHVRGVVKAVQANASAKFLN